MGRLSLFNLINYDNNLKLIDWDSSGQEFFHIIYIYSIFFFLGSFIEWRDLLTLIEF